jgi:hypothetical protein
MARQVIQLDISRSVEGYLSSGTYSSNADQALSHLDILYTYFFRYPRLLAVDIGKSTTSQGFAIDGAAANPVLGISVTALFLVLSIASVVNAHQKQKREDAEKVAQYRQTYNQVQARLQKTAVEEAVNRDAKREETNVLLNKVLKQLENEFPYENIVITAQGKINLFLKQQTATKQSFWQRMRSTVANLVFTSWITLGLASFTYWILWIGWGTLTASFAPAGIGSFGVAGFIVPLAVAAVYPLIKIYNWWKNNYSHKSQLITGEPVLNSSKKTLEAAAAVSKLLRRVMYAKERERLEREYQLARIALPASSATSMERLDADAKMQKLGKNKWRKTATTFLGVTIGSYIGAHYAAWIVTDILQVAANITLNSAAFSLGFGLAFMVLSVIYGAYKAYQKYQDVEADAEKIAQEFDVHKKSLEQIYQEKLNSITKLIAKIGRSSRNVEDMRWLREQATKFSTSKIISPEATPQVPTSGWEKFKKVAPLAYMFLAGATSGVMIARIATIAGTVAFVPFAAAALANPYTIAILVIVGLAYGAFKAIQYYYDRKEARAKALLEQRQEKIACLRQQSELADMQIAVLQAKLGVAADAQVKPQCSQDDCFLASGFFAKRTLKFSDDMDKTSSNSSTFSPSYARG